MSKWHLSGLLYTRLSSNHFSRSFEDFFKDDIKSSILSETAYGVVSSAYIVISVLFNVKNKSARNMLNTRGPKIEPCGAPNSISCYKLYESFTRTRSFLFDK